MLASIHLKVRVREIYCHHYLFIIGSEELARLINREAYSNAIKGVKVAANAPAVTKLFFVDDVNAFL